MKILILMGWFATDGIANYVKNVLSYINTDKYKVDIAIPRSGTYGAEQIITEMGYRVIYLEAESFPKKIAEIYRLLQTEQYSIVHIMHGYLAVDAYTPYQLGCVLKRKSLNLKIINHAHSTEDATKKITVFRRILREGMRACLRGLCYQSDVLAACSYEAGQFMYGNKANITVLYNGVDLSKFQTVYSPGELLQYCNNLDIPMDRLKLAIVARISNEKNPSFLLDVVKSLRRYYPNILLVWAGTGPMHDVIEREIATKELSDSVRLLGVQQNISKILSCCDYFILPSIREAAPISLIEAQAAGLQCFASDRVPNIIDCGSVSFISLDKSADQWADEIHTLIETNTKTGVNPALLQRFDIRETVQDLCKLYDSLLN